MSSFIPSSPAFGVFISQIYDTPERAPRMNVLFWGPGDFPVSYSNMDTSWNNWNRHSGSFMVDTGILFSNMKSPSHECQMRFWPLTSDSDFTTDQTFIQFHDLDTGIDLHRITSCLQRVWLASREHLPFRTPASCSVPLFGTCFCSNCWDQFYRTSRIFFRLFILNLLGISRFCFVPLWYKIYP